METLIIIAIGIVVIALLVGGFLISRNRKRHNAIVHYEIIRDKLTLRKKKVPEPKEIEALEESFEPSIFSLVSTLITMGFVMVIGFTILSGFDEAMNEAASSSNVTTEVLTSFEPMMTMFPLIMVVAVMLMGLTIAIRMVGFIEEGEAYEEAKQGVEKYKQMRDEITVSQVVKGGDKNNE